jgi:hypothetical protein
MMYWKGFEKKELWPNFMALSQHFPVGTEENHEKLQSG